MSESDVPSAPPVPTREKTTSFAQRFTRWLLSVFFRLRITGEARVPAHGPLIGVANHLSTADAMLVSLVLPPDTWYVGPADFKLLFPANLFLRMGRKILVKRSTRMELSSLKRMTDVVNHGAVLFLFPEGGTWEKGIYNAKGGAAYLSLQTGAPILTIGLGGTYQVWNKALRLRRPVVTVNVGPILPPVIAPERSKRGEALDHATRRIQRVLYSLIPPEDRALYDDWATRQYDLWVEVWRGDAPTMIDLPGRAALGEIVQKPNLFSPFWRNFKLPVDPFRLPGVRFTAEAVGIAARALLDALNGPLNDYIEYRLGVAKAAETRTALAALADLARTPGVTGIALKPTNRPGPQRTDGEPNE
ncbi:MAG: 1-acyl-sn-glycerol-3-phosphate acyltransferase [Anaerolineae bacterium]|nr:1-acyl-sn-glycerol-3-phosphate acyltransferase [Anaerolineae bacterium]